VWVSRQQASRTQAKRRTAYSLAQGWTARAGVVGETQWDRAIQVAQAAFAWGMDDDTWGVDNVFHQMWKLGSVEPTSGLRRAAQPLYWDSDSSKAYVYTIHTLIRAEFGQSCYSGYLGSLFWSVENNFKIYILPATQKYNLDFQF
jgi:hypothetical protein